LKSKDPKILQALTIINLNMHFMEIMALQNKESITLAHTLDHSVATPAWLSNTPIK
jgi:hypothetical protein